MPWFSAKVSWPGEVTEGSQVCEVLLEPQDGRGIQHSLWKHIDIAIETYRNHGPFAKKT